MRGLAGRTALVSGAARGMGAAAAQRLVEEGANVVLGDILDDVGKVTAEQLREDGRGGRGNAHYVRLDVTSADDWREAVAYTEREFGRLDVLVNNAGVLGFATIAEMPIDDYRRIVEVNQVGVFLGMRASVPALERAGGGSIVNISSVEGLGGGPGLTAYTASKFAVRGMSKAAAWELGKKGIRVNSVHPGAIKTDMVLDLTGGEEQAEQWMGKQVALHRMGDAHEVAAVVAFLASDDSSYCTGAEFVVDGGVSSSSGFKF